MKTRIITLSVLLFLTAGSMTGQNWNKISKEIRKEQYELVSDCSTSYIDDYYRLRKKSGYLKKFSPVSKNDTVFIIETFGFTDGLHRIYASFAWNKSEMIGCGDVKTYTIFHNGQIHSDYVMKLIEEWNIEEIRKEDEVHGGSLSHDIMNFAARIIFKGKKKFEIDCIYFRNFVNLEKDMFSRELIYSR